MKNNDIYDFYIPKYMELGIGSSPNKNLHNYYLEYALKKGEIEILEIGYGSGLLTVPLLKNNIKVIGVDKSEKSYYYLSQKCKNLEFFKNLVIETTDILEYSSFYKFNTILAPDEFLVHFLSKESLNLFLKKISGLLNINGVFITDIRDRSENEFTKMNCYPIYTLGEEINGVKYIRCSSWLNLTDDNLILVNYHYEEMDLHGVVINSFIKILKQGEISFDEIRVLAGKNNLFLSITEEADLGCNILQFRKIG